MSRLARPTRSPLFSAGALLACAYLGTTGPVFAAAPRLQDTTRPDAYPDRSLPALQNGDTLRFQANWLESPTEFSVDFGDLDDNRGQTTIVSMGAQGIQTRWFVTHVIPRDNTRGDGLRIPIRMEARKRVNPDSVAIGTGTALVCLANQSVQEIETHVVEAGSPFGFAIGDTVRIDTRWIGGNGLPLSVSADFRAVQTGYAAKDHLVAMPTSGAARIEFKIPSAVVPTAPATLAIPVRCYYDADCVLAESRLVTIRLDPVRPQIVSIDRIETDGLGNPPLKNGETLTLRARWNTVTERISADFSALDANLGLTTITADAGVAAQWTIRHVLALDHPVLDASDLAIPITGYATGHADTVETDARFRVCLSNYPPEQDYVRFLEPPPYGYGAGDTVKIETRWTSRQNLPLTYAVDLAVVDSSYDATRLFVTTREDGSAVLRSVLSSRRGHLRPSGIYALRVSCADPGCGSGDATLSLRLDTDTPQLLDFARLDTLAGGAIPSLRTGDRLVLQTRWSPGTYRVAADFRGLDDNVTPTTVEPLGDGTFRLTHVVGRPSSAPDRDSIRVVLTGFWREHADSAGVDSSIMVCVSNHPPRQVWTHLDSPSAVGYGLDAPNHDITIRTKWVVGPGQRAETYYADFSKLVARFDPGAQVVVQNDDGSVSITFRPNEQESGVARWDPVARELHGVPIPVFCLDDGCGEGRSDSVFVDWDGIRPQIPVGLDPLPASTSSAVVLISGTARGASYAAISVSSNRTLISRTFAAVDSATGRFSQAVALKPDATNDLLVRSADRVQNVDLVDPPATWQLVQVSSGLVEISKPFRPGRRDSNSIRVWDPAGLVQLQLRLFDLAGSCVMHWDVPGPQVAADLSWNGVGPDGMRAGQGMYLLRASWRNGADRQTRTVTQPLFLQE